MLRRFNYTGRKRIPRANVLVKISAIDGQAPVFDADFDLSGMKLPGDAKVYVEAYHRASYMRFSYGSVSEIRRPTDRALVDIEGGGTALFRLKVIDESTEHGQVLAEADGLTPFDANESNANRRPILPVVICDLGDQIWRLSFNSPDGRPVLELNKNVEGIAQLAKTGDGFFALVYPSVVSTVLHRILRGKERVAELDGPDDDWRYQWLRFVRALPGVTHSPTLGEDSDDTTMDGDDILEDDQVTWIDDAIEAFCSHFKVLDRYRRSIGQGGE